MWICCRPRSGNPVDRTRGDAARIGALEYGHPVFAPFRAPRSGDFSSVPVYGYRSLTAAKNAQVLARFDARSARSGRAAYRAAAAC